MGGSRGVPFRRLAFEPSAAGGRDVASTRAERRCTPVTKGVLALLVLILLTSLIVMFLAGQASPAASLTNFLAQLVASGLATAAAAGLAIRHPVRGTRRPAVLTALGCGLWFLGELVWFLSEWVVDLPLPDVSVVDLMFLALPVSLAVAIWLPLRHSPLLRMRLALDSIIIAASLFVISWTVVLTHLPFWGGASGATLVTSLLYPCADIVALTTLLLGVSRFQVARTLPSAIATAMAVIAVADTVYAVQTVTSTFVVGTVVDLGWIVGFGILAVAVTWVATWDRCTIEDHIARNTRSSEAGLQDRGAASMLPYLPVAAALVVVTVRHLVGTTEVIGELLVFLILGLVLLRQYLTLRDNRVLTRDLAAREQQLRQQAYHDVLTGLPNRALFTERVVGALERHRQHGRPLALLFLDLDDFKAVNDTLGHPVGDELVTRVGSRLRRLVRSTDTVSRFGGDEFAILVEGDHDAVAMADRLVQELRAPFALQVRALAIGCSIGIAQVTADAETPGVDELFSRADIAMYAAKRAGKGQQTAHHPRMVLPEADDLHYRPLLIDAVSAGRIDCLFQPIVELDTGRLVSLEALARWAVDGRLVDQAYFIDLAGRSGLLSALTDHMLDQACRYLADWNRRFGCTDLKVSVNVPPGLMTDSEFPERVMAILRRHEVEPRQLALEITEDALLGDYRTTQVVAQHFRRLEIEVWLDDFGSGYSSMLSLRRICLQSVKIDLEFVANIHRDPEAEQFLAAMLRLTKELDLIVTAEGVELPEQADILRELGCNYAQGFLYSEPVSAAAIEGMLLRGMFGAALFAPTPLPPVTTPTLDVTPVGR